ncbi:MAG TPA: branched-chain amino acid ABC transporter permease, partial [Methylomirabilota bacterium]|nr:branched-chain amino acid ABC transporter permease [Methylomirabilota bacterium]
MLEQILVQTVNGLVNGMVLALVASGLTLIFGIMDVVNFAHGDLVMLGGFAGAVTVAQTGNFWLGLVVASLAIGVFGALLQITTLRPLIGREPLTTIIATFGISLVLQKYALWQFGSTAQNIPQPITGQFQLFYLQYP